MKKYTEIVVRKQGGYDLIAGAPYIISVEANAPVTLVSPSGEKIGTLSGNSQIEYTPTKTGRINLETEAEKVSLTYHYGKFGTLDLELAMPCNYNLGMTETAKSYAHRMIVDYVMYTLLLNQWPEKSAIYRERFNLDADGLRNAMQARTHYSRNAADWS